MLTRVRIKSAAQSPQPKKKAMRQRNSDNPPRKLALAPPTAILTQVSRQQAALIEKHHAKENIEQSCQDYVLNTVEPDPFKFIQLLLREPRHSNCSTVLPMQLRSCKDKITLVVDLDETLVHCDLDMIATDIQLEIFGNSIRGSFRPHVFEFMHSLKDHFELVLFTASIKEYADAVMDLLDPHYRIFKYRLYREHCIRKYDSYIKDLSCLNRDLARVVILDNAPQSFAYNVSNGLPINSWFDDAQDRALLQVSEFLLSIKDAADVRPILSDRFKLQEIVDSM